MFKYLSLCTLLTVAILNANAQLRMVAKANLKYEPATNTYKLSDSSCYRYSGNRGGAPNEAIKCDTGMFLQMYPGSLKIEHRFIQQFDATDQVVVRTVEIPDNGGWRKMGEENYKYDPNGNLLVKTALYQYAPGVWDPREKTINTYNSNGKIERILEIARDPLNAAKWDTASRSVYHYDISGNLLIQVDTIFAGIPREADSTKYSYDASGLCIYISRKHLRDFFGAQWEDGPSNAFSYNANNDIDVQYFLDKNGDTTAVETNHYSGHQLTSVVHKRTDSTIFTYNSEGYLNSYQMFEWFAGSWSLRHDNPAGEYYYEPNFPVGLKPISSPSNAMTLYPVPASNTLHIQMIEKEQNPYSLIIADREGKLLFRDTYLSNSNKVINVNELPTGIYNITLIGTKGDIHNGKISILK